MEWKLSSCVEDHRIVSKKQTTIGMYICEIPKKDPMLKSID